MAVKKLPKDVCSLLKSSSTISSYYRAVEELVYNSLDSKANAIALRINLKEHNIEVIDNGTAITEDNLKFVGLRHMTNKYFSHKQGQNPNQYYGHKGMALAILVDISLEVIITTRCEKSQLTYERHFHKGSIKAENKGIGKMRASKGTTVKVKGFMYNLSVRRNSINILTEMDEIKKCLENIALIHPTISFSLRDDDNNNLLMACHKCMDIRQRIRSLFSDTYEVFEELKVEKKHVKIEGFFCNKLNKLAFANLQHVYVNKQLIFHSKIHKIINSLVKIKDESLINQKIKDMKHKMFTKWVNQEKVDLPYIIIITCPYNSYDLSYVPKKTVVEFHNWNLVTNCLKKLIQFYLEVSVKVLDKNAKIEPDMGRKQSASVNLAQDVPSNCENVLSINLDNSDSIIPNKNHVDEVNETINSLVKRVLKNNNNVMFGVSQLKNGIKGKAVKRKVVTTKYRIEKKNSIITKDTRIVQDRNKMCMNNPGENSRRWQNGTRNIIEQSKFVLNNDIDLKVKSRDEISIEPSNVSNIILPKTKDISQIENQALVKQNSKNYVAIAQKKYNTKTFGTYNAKKRCNNISKRLNHIMLKRRSEYLNVATKKSHQRSISIKEHKNIKMYENNNLNWCVKNTSGQMVVREFIPFKKYMDYGSNLKKKKKCFKKYFELKPKTNKDLLKPMVRENSPRNHMEKNCFNKESRFLQRKLFNEQEYCRNNCNCPFIFDNCINKLKYAKKTEISEKPEKIYPYNILTYTFNEPLNNKKIPRNLLLEKKIKAIDFHTSNITILSNENNMQSSKIYESFEPITWCSHEKYNINQEIHTNLKRNVPDTRVFHHEISPVIKPSDNIESIINYEHAENLKNDIAKKWGDFEFFERENGIDKINDLKKRLFVTKTIRRSYKKLNNMKCNYADVNQQWKLKITKAFTESLGNSRNNCVYNQNECKEFSVSNQSIFTINCSKNATIRNVENSYLSANASQTLADINFAYKKENSNNLNDIEVLFSSNCVDDNVTDIGKDLCVAQSDPLEPHCIHERIVPSELCKIILESSDIFEESAHNLSSNLAKSEKQYYDTENNIFGKFQENGLKNLERNIGIETFDTENNIKNIQNNEIEYNSDLEEIPEEIKNQELSYNLKATKIHENIETKEFKVFKRPNYFPKGMSPMIMNKGVTSVTLRNMYPNSKKYFQDQYFNQTTYEAFVQDVEKHTIAFESEAQKLDKITSDAIHNARLRMRNNVSSMVFHADSIKTLRLLKQLDTKFIAVIIASECSDEPASCLALFDQHAVHERIRIEALCADYKDGNNWIFTKCNPFFLYMSTLQISQIFHYRDKFSDIGLHFVSYQDTSDNILVVAVPMCVYSKEQKEPGILHDTVKALVLEQLEVLQVTKGIGISNPKTIMDLVNMEACRYAIKFGDQLSVDTCARLVRQLSLCAAPFQCAHGRPSMAPIVQIKLPVYQYKVNKTKLKMFSKQKNSFEEFTSHCYLLDEFN